MKLLVASRLCSYFSGGGATGGGSQHFHEFILAGGLEHFLLFHILGIIIPTDFHIFQRCGSTTNQYIFIAIDVPNSHWLVD